MKENLIKIDLAAGGNKKEGFIGVDIVDIEGIDIVHDLTSYPWPFESNSVEEIHCSHYIEHIKHDNVALDLKQILNESSNFEEFKEKINNDDFVNPKDGFIKFINEIHRILKPGGKAKLIAPYYSSMRAIGDPTHVRNIGDSTFWYVDKKWMTDNKLLHYGIDCNFEVRLAYLIVNELTLKSEEVRDKAFKHDLNVIDDIIVELIKK